MTDRIRKDTIHKDYTITNASIETLTRKWEHDRREYDELREHKR